MTKKKNTPTPAVQGNREPLSGLRQRTNQTSRDGNVASDTEPLAKARSGNTAAGSKTTAKSQKKTTRTTKAASDQSDTEKKAKKKRARVSQRSMSIKDLVPGPLPGQSSTPQQTAIPRKIRP